nr:unnamed protein product [Digitaria exilis]
MDMQWSACVIDWSDQLTRAEADLRTAVFVTLIGSASGPGTNDLEIAKAAVSGTFNLNRDTLVLRRSHVPGTFILLSGDEATASRLVQAGPASGPGGLRLHCRHWSRQAYAEGGALPSLVEVKLHGVPAHAWEMSTAESLLSPYGWPHLLHPATRNREDYSAFKVSAWCFKANELPRARDLHVVEPPIGDILSPPGKPTLIYPVSLAVLEVLLSAHSDAPSDPSEGDADADGRRRRRQRRSSAPQSAVPMASNEQQLAAIVEAVGVGVSTGSTDALISNVQQEAAVVEASVDVAAGFSPFGAPPPVFTVSLLRSLLEQFAPATALLLSSIRRYQFGDRFALPFMPT